MRSIEVLFQERWWKSRLLLGFHDCSGIFRVLLRQQDFEISSSNRGWSGALYSECGSRHWTSLELDKRAVEVEIVMGRGTEKRIMQGFPGVPVVKIRQ